MAVVVVGPTAAAFGSQLRGVCSASHPASISHENFGSNAKETAWRCVEEAGILTRREGSQKEEEGDSEEDGQEGKFCKGLKNKRD